MPVLLVVALLAACHAEPPAGAATAPLPAATETAEAARTAAARTEAARRAAARDAEAAVDQAIDSVLGDHAAYRTQFDRLRAAVAADDAPAVAALVAYPFTARIGGKRETIADAAAFVLRYDDIVTPGIRRVIADQGYGALFVEQQGVMFGRGEVWLAGTCRDGAACRDTDVRVVAIQPVLN